MRMDVDEPASTSASSSLHVNAEAGPSSHPDPPPVYLPQPGPSRKRPPLDSTQDLITRFRLLPSYDKYVRPHIQTSDSSVLLSSSQSGPRTPGINQTTFPFTPGTLDKGKGREVQPASTGTVGAPSPRAGDGGDGDDGDEETGKGDKKQKNSYKHLIKGIPGKHSTKKDDFLQTMMMVPPKQQIAISKFDSRTQREAFAVSLEGLKNWNINVLVAESAQAREDRKKRKEAKKLSKSQGTHPGVLLPITSTTSSSANPTPGLRPMQTPTSVGVGTPRPIGSSASPNIRPELPTHAQSGPSPAHKPSTPIARPGSRAKKRELEDDGSSEVAAAAGVRGVGARGGINGNAAFGQTQANSHPGLKRPQSQQGLPGKGGVPRPAKRPRTDGTPHQLGLPTMPQQQPTPQGV